ncbi:tripartite tricarboxylate transporter TctB family protein [Bradyrhizobium sp. dw_78]|uniref:tripartite tricarboxylate transporter TctB family protein n=1 Tax=Bradyrhizobium sp. dw_78 TaxID=2719793 RepID=UPI001BD50371|nr:tripartite tricarboxylate transporter TctB family protein [Bradyrhizobium sp. dw_78]
MLLAAIAIIALCYIRTLTVGTVLEMGPGYFPLGLALVLLGLGLCLLVKGLFVDAPPVGEFHLRPLFFILLSFAAFGLLIERAGIMVAILAQVAVAHFASRETTVLQSVLTGIGCAVVSAVVFVLILQIPVSILP